MTESSQYAAVIELWGRKELASSAPDRFERFLRILHNVVRRILSLEGNGDTGVCFLIDRCFLFDHDVNRLISNVQQIRDALFGDSEMLLIRGVIAEAKIAFHPAHLSGPQKVVWRNPERTLGYLVNNAVARLVGKMEAFDAVGIRVDDDVYSNLASGERNRLLPNFVVTKQECRPFVDLRFSEGCLSETALLSVLQHLEISLACSKRMARSFIPLLVNWSQSMDLGAELPNEPDRFSPETLDQAVAEGRLSGLHKIPGFEVFYWVLASRLLTGAKPVHSGRLAEIMRYVVENKDLHSLMQPSRHENCFKQICSEDCQSRFHNEFRLASRNSPEKLSCRDRPREKSKRKRRNSRPGSQ